MQLLQCVCVCVCVCVTWGLVSTDVEQARAPASPRLRDGGDGCRGDAEAGLSEYWVCRCRGVDWPAVGFTSCGEAPRLLPSTGWWWAFGYWQSGSEIRFFNESIFRWMFDKFMSPTLKWTNDSALVSCERRIHLFHFSCFLEQHAFRSTRFYESLAAQHHNYTNVSFHC